MPGQGHLQRPARGTSGAGGGATAACPLAGSGASARAQSAELHALLGPVQASAAGQVAAPAVKRYAAQGFAGPSSSLPHLDAIQRSFGRHGLTDVRAFVGGPAAAASEAMSARAYTSGPRIAFGHSPDLHTAAHEAAHVVQQRAGVALTGGVGKSGDAYERHADQVADAVAAGRSAEGLLDGSAQMTSQAGAEAVQRKAAEGAAKPADPQEGHELWVSRSVLGFPYHHAGVHVGNDQVVHVFAEPKQALKDMVVGNPIVKVRKTSFAEFAQGDSVTRGPAAQAYPEPDATMRAQSLVGLPWTYNPVDNNCQHFSSEMVSGSANSPEGDAIKNAFMAVVNFIAGGVEAVIGGIKKVASSVKKAAKGAAATIKGWFT